ncbi:MAG TPA: DUF4239 domain-containing protein [Candidatus Binatia bacterium]|nr:DUF4239 domain-containing protein [Candidatus Binatia bacterium]
MNELQLAALPTPLLGVLVVGSAVALATAGLLLVRRIVPLHVLEANHEVGGILIQIVAPAYSVLLAFTVFTVWTQYDEANTFVQQEANRLGNLFRNAQGLPDPERGQVQEALRNYVQLVINEEWEAMGRGEASQHAWEAYDELFNRYSAMEPLSGRQANLYNRSLENLNALGDLRTRRLLDCRSTLPGVLWALLVGGGVITTGFSYLFGTRNLWAQVLMTAAAAGTLAFFLFLILAIDLPFSGGLKLTPDAFQFVLEHAGPVTASQ